MKLRSLGPKSLAGQMAMMVAIALFLAQAINFTLLLRDRRHLRVEQVIRPAITRLVDASERLNRGTLPTDNERRGGGRVLLLTPRPLAPVHDARDVEGMLRDALVDAGLPTGQILTLVRPFRPGPPPPRFVRGDPGRRRNLDNLRRNFDEVLIAVEQPGHGWLVLRAGWPRGEGGLLWQLIAQTLVVYGAVMIAILFIGRRMAQPLKELAASARHFSPSDGGLQVTERGPSDVRAVIQAYNDLSTRVTAMLDEKDRMLGALGHDLRTPLAALRIRIESVEEDEDRNRMADIIEDMSRTLDDILSLARLGRPSEPLTDTDLAALVDAVVEDFRDLGVDVTTEECPRVRMTLRPALMRRAIRNLIENAVKYAGSAEVRIVPGTQEVLIQVCDRGPGIPQDKQGDVFESFTRLEISRNRDTGGIGLGLALARAIVRDARGEITLKNREDGGLIATITLPR